MSDNIINPVWLIGAGYMSIEYTKVLKALNVPFKVIGRSEKTAKSFYEATGIKPQQGGIEKHLSSHDAPLQAIIAVSIEELAKTAILLMKNGVKQILIEKPAGLNLEEIKKVSKKAKARDISIFVAYNRRFYSSTLRAEEIIKEDGGVTSFNFEFTEWSHVIKDVKKHPKVKENWFLANSTHVVDLAFYLGGYPEAISCYTAGEETLDWHPSASIYAGAGVAKNGALFSYQANWQAPGRWSVEILTRKHRLIFRPMEKLKIQEVGSIKINEVEIEDDLDQNFKPGLYLEVKNFLENNLEGILPNIHDHKNITEEVYMKMRGAK